MNKAALWMCLAATALALPVGGNESNLALATQAPDQMAIFMRPRDFGGPDQVRARDFLWQHWRNKTPAQLDVTSWTREGVRHDRRYEIIPGNTTAVVAITVKTSEDPSAPISGLAVPQGTTIADIPRVPTTVESFKAATVERIRRVRNSDELTIIPTGKTLPSKKYRLRFKDDKGEVLGTF